MEEKKIAFFACKVSDAWRMNNVLKILLHYPFISKRFVRFRTARTRKTTDFLTSPQHSCSVKNLVFPSMYRKRAGTTSDASIKGLLKEHLKFIVAIQTNLSFARKEIDTVFATVRSFDNFDE